MNPSHRALASPFGWAVRFFVFGLTVFALTPADIRSQQDDIENLVFSVSEALIDATKTAETKPTVRVENFRDIHGTVNQLGIDLASRFSDLLEESSKTPLRTFFAVLTHFQDANAYYEQPCDREHPWPQFMVKGDLDELDDGLTIWVHLIEQSSRKSIFDRRITIPLSPPMKDSISKPPSASIRPADVWVRPGYALSEEEELKAAHVDQKAEGFIALSCQYCPRAEYSDQALATKIQGVVTLKMLVSADGDPLKLEVLDGLPCGLNQRTLQTVARWKLKPAKTPDGKPVEVWQVAEVTFQLY